jgi:predicted PurR-regulated permease PerM
MMANDGHIAEDTLFEPERLAARAIDWDQSDRGLSSGRAANVLQIRRRMHGRNRNHASIARKALAPRKPSIHGPRPTVAFRAQVPPARRHCARKPKRGRPLANPVQQAALPAFERFHPQTISKIGIFSRIGGTDRIGGRWHFGSGAEPNPRGKEKCMGSERWIRTDTILLTAGLLLIGYLVGNVILLVFAAVLIAVGLDGSARAIAGRLPVSRGWALVAVTFGILAFIIGVFGLSAGRLVQQLRDVSEAVVEFAQRTHAWLIELGVMEESEGENGGLASTLRDMTGEVMTWGMTAVGAVTSLIILVILTAFISGNPALYRGGAVRLVPPEQRGLVEDTLSALAHAIRWWFLGQLVSMALLGVTVGLGLFVLGVELWLGIAVLTALLTFIPFIGPLIAAVPVVAVGFAAGMQTGLIVLVGYLVVQNIEGSVIGPMIQQKAVNLPPALLIAAQVLLSLIFGVVGLILAAPLAIVAMVTVQKLWVEHALGEKVT